jgi:hypothetical protein
MSLGGRSRMLIWIQLPNRSFPRKHHQCVKFYRLLAEVLDSTNVQITFVFQLNQFIACCNVAAVQPPIRDVPCIVLAVM